MMRTAGQTEHSSVNCKSNEPLWRMGNRRKRGEREGPSAMAKEGKEEGVAVSDGRERASGASEVSARRRRRTK